jgi:starvation-inducible outer membrane lipoprotein
MVKGLARLQNVMCCRPSQRLLLWKLVIRGDIVLLSLSIFTGCAPPQLFSSPVMAGIDHSFDFVRWRRLPNETPPAKIQVGGRIVQADTQQGKTTIVVAQLPIVRYPAYGPKEGKSQGQFAIVFKRPIEPPGFLHRGNRLIVVGTTSGTINAVIDDIVRTVPALEALCIHIWKTGNDDIADFASSGGGFGTLEEETFCSGNHSAYVLDSSRVAQVIALGESG